MSDEKKREFKLLENKNHDSGVLRIQVGAMTLSVTTINGINEMVVFSESGDAISEVIGVTDFSQVIHMMWNLERIADA